MTLSLTFENFLQLAALAKEHSEERARFEKQIEEGVRQKDEEMVKVDIL